MLKIKCKTFKDVKPIVNDCSMRISIILFSTTLLKVLLYLLSEHKHKHTKETLKVLLNLIKT